MAFGIRLGIPNINTTNIIQGASSGAFNFRITADGLNQRVDTSGNIRITAGV